MRDKKERGSCFDDEASGASLSKVLSIEASLRPNRVLSWPELAKGELSAFLWAARNRGWRQVEQASGSSGALLWSARRKSSFKSHRHRHLVSMQDDCKHCWGFSFLKDITIMTDFKLEIDFANKSISKATTLQKNIFRKGRRWEQNKARYEPGRSLKEESWMRKDSTLQGEDERTESLRWSWSWSWTWVCKAEEQKKFAYISGVHLDLWEQQTIYMTKYLPRQCLGLEFDTRSELF